MAGRKSIIGNISQYPLWWHDVKRVVIVCYESFFDARRCGAGLVIRRQTASRVGGPSRERQIEGDI